MHLSHLSLLLGFLLTSCLLSSTIANYANQPAECCFKFYEKRIPVNALKSYEDTRSDCPRAGVIFVTQKNFRICADPGFKWVKWTMKKIDERAIQ
ncbi:C-C motif chemokine 36.1 [Chanos chanos]|uniref:C-C motif chemokine n=1 Tax=Chanos chanos TaxID=29144 RepID=A0A6J2VSU0_CHACN|nr:C-C motif chemokine 4 homolog [Chanos chanos]